MKIFKFIKKRICNQQGSWVATAAITGIAGLGLSGAGMIMGSSASDKASKSQKSMFEREFAEKSKPATFLEAPRFKETDAAREDWWSKIQDLGEQPGFVDPSIMENVKTKLSQYYWGSPTGPGAIDKIRSSAARRGVSDSPALGVLESRMGAEEGGKLADITASLGTSGKRDYLSNIMQLANLQVPGVWDKYDGMQVAQPSSFGAGMGDVMGTIGSGLFDMAGNYYQQQWMEKMMDKYKTTQYGGITPGSITGGSTMGTYSGGNFGGLTSADLYGPTF